MRAWTVIAILALSACGKSEPAKAPAPPAAPAVPVAPVFKSDPAGKYSCLMCNLKTNEENCPKCKMSIKPKVEETVKAPASSGTSAAAGKTAVSAVFACPKEGCKFTDARKGKCLPHPDTDLQEQWFVCGKCSKQEPLAGKCAGCSGELKRTLK